jgi:hypothetical protein
MAAASICGGAVSNGRIHHDSVAFTNERYLLRTLVVRRSALKPIGKFWSGKWWQSCLRLICRFRRSPMKNGIVQLGRIARTRPALSDAVLNAIEGIDQARANAIATAIHNAPPPRAKSERLNEQRTRL